MNFDLSEQPMQSKTEAASFTKKPLPIIGWLHAKNATTSSIVSNFKQAAPNVCIKEFSSIEELKKFISSQKKAPERYLAMITEMGFWEDENQSKFNNTAGLIAMELINHWLPECRNKFVISARVGKNEDGLLDKSRDLGFIHLPTLDIIYDIHPISTQRERELHQCIGLLRNSLFAKPIRPSEESKYPISHFSIKSVLDIEHDSNTKAFLNKAQNFESTGKAKDWDWLFHGSRTKESTMDIAQNNFSLAHLGAYSGNRGCYGEGIYFSTRGYLPMVIAITAGHFSVIICKVMKGKSRVVKCLTQEEYTKGVPIPDPFDSNVSDNSLEVVVRDPSQILPSFIINFTVEGLKTLGSYTWRTPQGDKELPEIHCEGKKLLVFN